MDCQLISIYGKFVTSQTASFLRADINSNLSPDNQYVGSSTGLDEVNYKLQAFMELWKGLAHDVDDLYDKVKLRNVFRY